MAATGLLSRESVGTGTDRGVAAGTATAADGPARAPEFDFDIAIVGLGYVGLPTALSFHAAGRRVLGVDVSQHRLAVISEARADLLASDRERLTAALADPGFEMTSDTARLSTAAAVIICVPTPVDHYLVPDLRILQGACATVVAAATPGQVLLLTSTTYVGTTRDLLVAPLTARGLTAGRDVFVAFSPERIDPGNDRACPRRRPAGSRRRHPGLRRAGRGRAGRLRQERAHRAVTGRGGDDQAAGEHLPGGEHRAGQRVRRDLPGDGHGR